MCHSKELIIYFLFLLFGATLIKAQGLRVAYWIDPIQKDIYGDIANARKEIESLNLEIELNETVLVVESNNDELAAETMQKFCEIFANGGVSIVIDFTYQKWETGISMLNTHNVPFLRVDRMLSPYLRMFSKYLQQKDANGVVLILQNAQDTNEALFHIVDGFPFRTLLLNANDTRDFVKRLRDLRPSPSYYGILARGSNMNGIFEKISRGKLFLRPQEWHFIFLDTRERLFKYRKQVEYATKFTVNSKAICRSLQTKESYCTSGFTFQRAIIFDILRSLIEIKKRNSDWLKPLNIQCGNGGSIPQMAAKQQAFENFDIYDHFKLSDFMTFTVDNDEEDAEYIPTLSYMANVSIGFFSNEHEAVTDLAVWQNGEMIKINQTISPAKRFFRIGTTEAIPWSYYRRDVRTGKIALDRNGNPIWEGYCIDFINVLAEKLNFDYELIPPTTGKFGERDPKTGNWNGIVGDLVSGETDFAVTALKMYSDREEVIDYVAPYFEQTGISIVIRKPVRQTSLFKFMTVLRLEVWLSILGALVGTAVMLWLLDKYSPYSSTNNKEAYPYPCRKFTLRECFWFALTSFTPQGGGETPKAVSGRILVAAYWLFVVLMLATFTANLAAFLTVERMQTPVQSLDQLARQSRINYTVVSLSDTHDYFINMKFAEDTLYRMWKELALNASEDYKKFRIWDYPIKEQYGNILLAINGTGPVRDAEEGFRQVNEHEEADFAFIHDSSEIKYEITRNCNLTEIGEVFAEQPYAIAVQQGSHLGDELSYATLELQKDRYFEELKAKYWNRSRLKDCQQSEEQEGITLESLGGVFIATFFGLGLAVVTLILEGFYYKKILKFRKPKHHVTEVIPAASQPRTEAEAWHIDIKNPINTTPPPSFDKAVTKFRDGKKIPAAVTLGGEEFRPRRLGLQSWRELSNTINVTGFDEENQDDEINLPPYTE